MGRIRRTVVVSRIVLGLVRELDVVERHLHVVIMVVVGMDDGDHGGNNGI